MHIFIAGVASPIGRLLAETLLNATGSTTPAITRVTGLDPRPCLPPITGSDPVGLHFVRARFRQPEWTPLLHDVDTLIHVAGAEWPTSRRRSLDAALFADTRFVIDAALAAGVCKLIVVTNAALYGRPRTDHGLDESAPVRGHEASAYARARARIADYLDVIAARHPEHIITRLRTAWLCGTRHTALVRYAQTEPVLVRDFADHALDVIHEQDAIAAIMLALHSDLPGAYNVGYGADAEGQITLRDLAAFANPDQDAEAFAPGMLRATLRAWWRWRWRVKPTPPGWVRDFYRAGSLDAQRLRAAGWQPQHTAREAVQAALM